MIVEPTSIISRIEWCRLQQQRRSVTKEERADWGAEEAGLVDALFGRNRTALMREDHRSQSTRYQRGLEYGHALLCFQQVNSRWHDTYGEVGPGPLTTPTQMDRLPLQAFPPVYVESRP